MISILKTTIRIFTLTFKWHRRYLSTAKTWILKSSRTRMARRSIETITTACDLKTRSQLSCCYDSRSHCTIAYDLRHSYKLPAGIALVNNEYLFIYSLKMTSAFDACQPFSRSLYFVAKQDPCLANTVCLATKYSERLKGWQWQGRQKQTSFSNCK